LAAEWKPIRSAGKGRRRSSRWFRGLQLRSRSGSCWTSLMSSDRNVRRRSGKAIYVTHNIVIYGCPRVASAPSALRSSPERLSILRNDALPFRRFWGAIHGKLRVRFEPKSCENLFLFFVIRSQIQSSCLCKSRPLASHGTPWRP